jgi:hypothetical protein
MKQSKAGIISLLVLAAIFFTSSIALSQEKENCKHSVDLFINLTARFVGIPDTPPFSAEGFGEVCYEITDKGAVIKGESIPQLTFVAIDPPAKLKDLTVIVNAVPATVARLNWEKFPIVELSDVDLRVRAYSGNSSEIETARDPLVDIILSDLTFSTESIEVEGVASKGYIDAEKLAAMLVGSTILPEFDYPLYNEWLAGQNVLLELTVRMKNPYVKGDVSQPVTR